MRRDYFGLEIADTDWLEGDADPTRPRLVIEFDGPESTLRERLTGHGDDPLSARETDAVFRLKTPLDDPDAEGVFSLTNRLTGDFVLELDEDADGLVEFVRAARAYGEHAPDDARYEVVVAVDGEQVVAYEKRTLLVYDDDGNLLRNHSLIPSGVEL
jgi:hypothetical protein